ncbi:MAG: shikimate dehydrogenase, partial [Gammaproteobacteria bacterium]
MDRYAVVGNPINHSKSPFIHAKFAEQTGEDLRYEAVLGSLGGFADTVHTLRDKGFKGFNVTVPFKEEAWRMCDECSAQARRAVAVNTVEMRPDGALAGHNTDGVGLVRDLVSNPGVELADKRILIV